MFTRRETFGIAAHGNVPVCRRLIKTPGEVARGWLGVAFTIVGGSEAVVKVINKRLDYRSKYTRRPRALNEKKPIKKMVQPVTLAVVTGWLEADKVDGFPSIPKDYCKLLETITAIPAYTMRPDLFAARKEPVSPCE